MNFIKVTAQECNAQGNTGGPSVPIEFLLNIDLIGGIRGAEVFPKGSKMISIGGHFYTNLRLPNPVNTTTL